MKSFYLKTDKFSIFSRIVFTLLFIIAVIKIFFFDSEFESRNIIRFSISSLYISFNDIITYPKNIQKTSSICS